MFNPNGGATPNQWPSSIPQLNQNATNTNNIPQIHNMQLQQLLQNLQSNNRQINNITPHINSSYTSIPGAVNNFSTIPPAITASSTTNTNMPPGFYQFGDGNSMTLMADDVKHLNNSDTQIFRLLTEKFNIYGAHLITINVKQFKDKSGGSDAIKIPSKPASKVTPQADDIDVLNHVKRGSIPASTKRQRQQSIKSLAETDAIIVPVYKMNTSIKDSGLTNERYKELLELIINNKSVDSSKLNVDRKEAVKIQNNLYCNGIVTLGTQYNYEEDKGKRVANITKQIHNGKWKIFRKTNTIDDEVFNLWIKLTKTYNDKIDSKNAKHIADNDDDIETKKRKRNANDNNSDLLNKKQKICGLNSADPV
eukprot:297678_1